MSSPAATVFTGQDIQILYQSKRAGLDAHLTQRLVDFIDGTHTSLDGAIYDLRHPAILAALSRVVERHVRLRLAYDGGKERTGGLGGDPKSGSTEEALSGAGLLPFATAVHEQGRHLMHDKFLVRDGKEVWVGSANFTVGGLELQDNTCLIISSPQLAGIYTATLEELLLPHHRHMAQAGAPETVQVGDVRLHPYFAPASGEGIEQAIISALRTARRVRVLAFLLSDPGILAALAPLAHNSTVDVQGVYDPHGMQDVLRYSHQDPSVFWFLHDPRFVAAPSHGFAPGHEQDFMHNKTLIIDDDLVFTGSYNFSENAENNDETLLAIESPAIAAAYSRYMKTLFAAYKGTAEAPKIPAHAAHETHATHSTHHAPEAVPMSERIGQRLAEQRQSPKQTRAGRKRRSGLDRAIAAVAVLFFVGLGILVVLLVLLATGVLHL